MTAPPASVCPRGAVVSVVELLVVVLIDHVLQGAVDLLLGLRGRLLVLRKPCNENKNTVVSFRRSAQLSRE